MLQPMGSQRVGHDLVVEQQEPPPSNFKKKKKKNLPQPLGHLLSCPLSLPLDRSRLRLSRLHLTGVALMPPVTCLHPSPPFPAPWRGDVLRAQL